jgi:LuxR family maltose regulon positive regulatory protein
LKPDRKNLNIVKDALVARSSSPLAGLKIEVATAEWFSWLNSISSFAYESPDGTFTARKEQAKNGKSYWKAYRKKNKKLFQYYLGRSEDLVAEKLQAAAKELTGRIEHSAPGPVSKNTNSLLNGAGAYNHFSPLLTTSSSDVRNVEEDLESRLTAGEQASGEATPMLATKLQPPVLRPGSVIRPRLLERLNRANNYKLTLLSAPPGFGKTTLAVQWLKSSQTPFSWISLDPQDNDPARFWRYFIQALENFKPGINRSLATYFRPFIDLPMVTALINQLVDVPAGSDFVMVLEDYNLITSDAVHRVLQHLVECLPDRLRLVVISRTEPPLFLAGLRARGEVNEIKASDLRFTLTEAQAFFQEVMGLSLPEHYLTTLEARTEGWIAGMQLAALGIQGQTESQFLVTSLQGSHHFIFDYLAQEVLNRQSPDIRYCLLRTSLLEPLCAPLIEAVTGCEDGQAFLEYLERANLFLVALDPQHRWYRYHNLFREFLRDRLQEEQPEQLYLVHRWAARWYEEYGLLAEAIEHNLLGKDYERLAGLVERLETPGQQGEWLTMKKWLRALPETLITQRPRLLLNYIWVLINDHQLSLAEKWLDYLLAWPLARTGPIRSSAEWTAELINVQAWLAFNQGNILRTLELCRDILSLKVAGKAFIQLNFLSLIEQSYPFNDLTEVNRIVSLAEELIRLSRQPEQPFMRLLGFYILFTFNRQQARFRETHRLCREIIEFVEQEPWLEGYAQNLLLLINLTLGLTSYYSNELAQAECEIKQGLTLCQKYQNLEDELLFLSFLGRVKLAQHEHQTVSELLQKINRLEAQCNSQSPSIATAQAAVANIWLQTGNLEAAALWAKQQRGNPEDRLSISKEWIYLVQAQVQIAQKRYSVAEDLLKRLMTLAVQVNRQFLIARTAALLAVALFKQAKVTEAFSQLNQALEIAEREGLEQVLLENGQSMLDLLTDYLRINGLRGPQANFIKKMLGQPEGIRPFSPQPFMPVKELQGQTVNSAHIERLVEPLSAREKEVLRLLTTSLSIVQIGRELFVATSTIRTHVKNIYAKLGVQNRMEAINRAKELNLL